MSLPGLASESSQAGASELRVNMVNMRRALDAIIGSALARRGFTLFTVNLDHMVKLGQSAPFRDAYARADYITADGWPIVWLARGPDRRKTPRPGSVDRRKSPSLERTTGADLLEPMCREAARHGLPLYFIGPSPASQTAGLRILCERYPGLIVAGAETAQIPAEIDEAVVEDIGARLEKSGAHVCVVSLGAPKQEVLADALHRRCPDVGFLCVGAALDFISGHAVRAPVWVRRAGMEWFWRMISDPKRLVGRYIGCGFTLFKLSLPSIFKGEPQLRVVDPD